MEKYKPTIKLYEMSNFFPDKTGLKYTMWISTMSGKEKHWARIKLSNTEGYIEVSIWGEPKIKEKKGNIKISGKDFKNIVKFIKLNKETLMNHWLGSIDSGTLRDDLQKI